MMRMLSTVAVTMLVALLCVVPAVLMRPYVSDFVDPALQQIAAAAWLSGMLSWMLAALVRRRQQARALRAIKLAKLG